MRITPPGPSVHPIREPRRVRRHLARRHSSWPSRSARSTSDWTVSPAAPRPGWPDGHDCPHHGQRVPGLGLGLGAIVDDRPPRLPASRRSKPWVTGSEASARGYASGASISFSWPWSGGDTQGHAHPGPLWQRSSAVSA